MNEDNNKIIERITNLEGKSLQVDMQPTERENLKNNLFEGFGTATATDTKTYFKVMWKNKPYFIPTGLLSSGGYAGMVATDGTAVNLPSGWTCSTGGTGMYTVTHNLGLGSDGYATVGTCIYTAGAVCKLDNILTNSVDFNFTDRIGNLTNTRFNFIIIPF